MTWCGVYHTKIALLHCFPLYTFNERNKIKGKKNVAVFLQNILQVVKNCWHVYVSRKRSEGVGLTSGMGY